MLKYRALHIILEKISKCCAWFSKPMEQISTIYFFLCMSSAELHQKHLLLLPMLKTAFAAFCGYIHYTAVQTFGVTEIKKIHEK